MERAAHRRHPHPGPRLRPAAAGPAVPLDAGLRLLKLTLGTLAFVWILWTLRAVNPRAVGMTMTFPALNGIVLLSVTDKVVSEMVVAIFPLMLFNALLPALFIALHRRLARHELFALAICVAAWAALAALLEQPGLLPHRWTLAAAAAAILIVCAAWAFRRLRAAGLQAPPRPASPPAWRGFLRERAWRIFWFAVSLAIVTWAAHSFRDAHTLVGRLSALPLVSLFVLHWAVNARPGDLAELRISALIGPLAAGSFLVLFTLSLGLIRSDSGALHPAYWPIGLAMLLVEWELTRRLILRLSALTYR